MLIFFFFSRHFVYNSRNNVLLWSTENYKFFRLVDFILWSMAKVLKDSIMILYFIYFHVENNSRKFVHLTMRSGLCPFTGVWRAELANSKWVISKQHRRSTKNKVSYLRSWESRLHWSFIWSHKCFLKDFQCTQMFKWNWVSVLAAQVEGIKALHSVHCLVPEPQSRSCSFLTPLSLWFKAVVCH